MTSKWVDLFKGLSTGAIQESGGLIITTRFHRQSKYAIFEITAFQAAHGIVRMGEDSVAFHSDGYKIFLVYEPVGYALRFQEPYLREPDQQIPLRFSELNIIELPNHDRILINREPYTSTGSFTIEAPDEGDFAAYVYDEGKLEENAREFLIEVLRDDFGVQSSSMREVMEALDGNLEKFRTNAG